jgi:hypothetical protein
MKSNFWEYVQSASISSISNVQFAGTLPSVRVFLHRSSWVSYKLG